MATAILNDLDEKDFSEMERIFKNLKNRENLSEIPDDFHRAISMDEAIIRVEAGMRKIIKKHKLTKVS
jgi:hypothetical protein